MIKVLTLTILCTLGVNLNAQEPQISSLTFQSWKEYQILDAQNQVLRISARISQLKSGKPTTNGSKESATPLPNSKIRKSEGDSVLAAEKDLRRAQDSLRAAGELTLDEYVAVYLPTLREHPEALQSLAQKLSKDELAEIFKVLILNEAHPDARRNSPSLADGLSATSRAQAP